MNHDNTPKRYRDLDISRVRYESSQHTSPDNSEQKPENKAAADRMIKLRNLDPAMADKLPETELVPENSHSSGQAPVPAHIRRQRQKPDFHLVKRLQEQDDTVNNLEPPPLPQQQKKRIGRLLAVVFFGTGLLFFLFPPLSVWLSLWEMWQGVVPISAVAAFLFASLALSDHAAFRFLAASLVLSAMAVAFILSIFPMSAVIPELVTVQQYLPGSAETIAATLLFTACFFLLTGAGPIRYTVAVAVGILAFGMPWLALSTDLNIVKNHIATALLAPSQPAETAVALNDTGSRATILAPAKVVTLNDAYSISIPSTWIIAANEQNTEHLFSAPDSSLILRVRQESLESPLPFQNYVRAHLDEIRDNKDAGEISIDLPGPPRRHKVTLIYDSERAEILFMQTDDKRFMLAVSGSEVDFNACRLIVNRLFEEFEPYPAGSPAPENSDETALLH